MDIIGDKEKEKLQIIQKYCKCIHTYSKREISSWECLTENVYGKYSTWLSSRNTFFILIYIIGILISFGVINLLGIVIKSAYMIYLRIFAIGISICELLGI